VESNIFVEYENQNRHLEYLSVVKEYFKILIFIFYKDIAFHILFFQKRPWLTD